MECSHSLLPTLKPAMLLLLPSTSHRHPLNSKTLFEIVTKSTTTKSCKPNTCNTFRYHRVLNNTVVCVCACVRECERACVRACVHACYMRACMRILATPPLPGASHDVPHQTDNQRRYSCGYIVSFVFPSLHNEPAVPFINTLRRFPGTSPSSTR